MKYIMIVFSALQLSACVHFGLIEKPLGRPKIFCEGDCTIKHQDDVCEAYIRSELESDNENIPDYLKQCLNNYERTKND